MPKLSLLLLLLPALSSSTIAGISGRGGMQSDTAGRHHTKSDEWSAATLDSYSNLNLRSSAVLP